MTVKKEALGHGKNGSRRMEGASQGPPHLAFQVPSNHIG